MTERRENCPFAFRCPGDPNVLCRKIAEQPHVRWCYCAHQYMCAQTKRREATKVASDCKFRRNTT